MEAKIKVLISEMLILSLIGFIGIILVLAAGFIGHHVGLSKDAFDLVLLSLTGVGLIAFAVCSYRNCFKKQ
ncbi:MAG: hypothetical protein JXR65_00850 [Bacteroidales bacterium]|nr:hypothetical protein [Bacteroidales bacterium]